MAHNPIRRESLLEVTIPSPEVTPHGCYDGWVYLGIEGKDETGEPVEGHIPGSKPRGHSGACRRVGAESRRPSAVRACGLLTLWAPHAAFMAGGKT
jgi:hypothetical protein